MNRVAAPSATTSTPVAIGSSVPVWPLFFAPVSLRHFAAATKDVMPTEPLDAKFAAFNWNVVKCDGHDFAAIRAALAEAEACKGMPTVILLKTVKGKGVSFMENNAGWHGKAPNDEQFAQAKAELEAQIAQLEKEVG